MCHILLAMPILGLIVFLMFPLSTALLLYSFLLLLSAGFYYLVFHAMRARVVTGKEGMIGQTCQVLTALDQKGKVTYGNEVWFAESKSPVGLGEAVRIVGFRDLVLLVEPASGSSEGEDRDITGSKIARFVSCCFHKTEIKRA